MSVPKYKNGEELCYNGNSHADTCSVYDSEECKITGRRKYIIDVHVMQEVREDELEKRQNE